MEVTRIEQGGKRHKIRIVFNEVVCRNNVSRRAGEVTEDIAVDSNRSPSSRYCSVIYLFEYLEEQSP